MPIDRYQDEIATSIRGSELGFDNQRRLVGPPNYRIPTEFSTAGSTLDERGGLAVLSGSTDAWTLRAPLVAGIEKIVTNCSTLSTATHSVVRSTANGNCFFMGSTSAGGLGSTAPGVRINLVAAGAAVRLVSVSSAAWVPVGFTGNITSSAYTYTVSTSS
jgi:hypothetical protein